ncbi:disintegrin and metalloproteinase domain-containing protein 21-like [Ochotona princeps]|uniref:disintegrin and metalloproteinase domain-containing protein 21-like n=1 Tax=Ochotona princeps TaxID=9978 RepID=UPI00271551BA|nr:disintegrin and metalloproteinase domain-containing protein 21-like [Ochotona princeps]
MKVTRKIIGTISSSAAGLEQCILDPSWETTFLPCLFSNMLVVPSFIIKLCFSDGLATQEDTLLKVKVKGRRQTCMSSCLFHIHPHTRLQMAVSEAPVHVRNTLLMLWLGLLLFLSGWPQIGHSQHHSHLEVVIPMRVTGTRKGVKTPGWLSYSLHFGGQRHIIHMKAKKLLVSRHFPVFSYTDKDVLREDLPFIKDDCHYRGYVEGEPESFIALSSCFGGFHGILQINDTVYEIKPKRFSKTHEHLIHRQFYSEAEFQSIKWQGAEKETAGKLGFQERNNLHLMQEKYEGWWPHRWFVEFAVIIDHQRFIFRNGNITMVMQDVLITMNEVNSIFSAIDVSVCLCALEIWNHRNLVTIGNIYETLQGFCQWKYTTFDARVKNDAAHFFSRNDYLHEGESYWGKICQKNSCGIEKFFANDEFYKFALIVSREIGHNLNMPHDVGTCTCGKEKCLMSKGSELTATFSNCSISGFVEIIQKTTCLRNRPTPLKDLCGNGVVEEMEQCDCGTLKLCTQDPCCFANCTLRPGAACGSGLCCKDCKFRAAGELCREKDNECDLPEWCTGTSRECPEDVYLQNGETCRSTSHCYNNKCFSTRDEQCQQIFGVDAKNANQSCYRELNTRGDRFGNCGNDTKSYLACKEKDIMCGRIQCENVKRMPLLREHTTVHSVTFNSTTCWGTDYHFGMVIPDIGDVEDGTECAENSICSQKKCIPVQVPQYNCSHALCHSHGVCNNKDHCHCDSEWKPPTCKIAGYGGSIDSGPPPIPQTPQRPNVLLYILLILLIVLLLLLLVLCCIFFLLAIKDKQKEEEEKEKEKTAGLPPEGQSVAEPPVAPPPPTADAKPEVDNAKRSVLKRRKTVRSTKKGRKSVKASVLKRKSTKKASLAARKK